MNRRKLLYPFLVIAIACVFYFYDTQTYEKYNTPEEDKNTEVIDEVKTKNPVMNVPKYVITTSKHSIQKENQQVHIHIFLENNFPPQAQFQTYIAYSSNLGEKTIMELMTKADNHQVTFGPFEEHLLISGEYKVVTFYSPVFQESKDIPDIVFTESSYLFSYDGIKAYKDTYNEKKSKAEEILSEVKNLYDVAYKKFITFPQDTSVGEWNIWLNRWSKSFAVTKDKDRKYFQENLFIPLFPSTKRCVALFNLLEDLAEVDFPAHIEEKNTSLPYRNKRFLELYYETLYQFTFETIGVSYQIEADLVNEFTLYLNSSSTQYKKLPLPGLLQKENFLLHLVFFENLQHELDRFTKSSFAKESNQWLLKFKLYYNDVENEMSDSDIANYLPKIKNALVSRWFDLAQKTGLNISNTKSEVEDFQNLKSECIKRWSLEYIPSQAISESFVHLEELLVTIEKVLNEQTRLSHHINEIIMWQSFLVSRQEKNRQLLNFSLENKKLSMVFVAHAKLTMEILLFLEEARQETSKYQALSENLQELLKKVRMQKPQ